MQSVLQYRRFRGNLEQQISQHGLERVASSTLHPGPSRGWDQLGRAAGPAAIGVKDSSTEEKQLQNETPVLHSNARKVDDSGPVTESTDVARSSRQRSPLLGEAGPTSSVRDHAASGSTLLAGPDDKRQDDNDINTMKSPSLVSSNSAESGTPDRTVLTTVSTQRTQGTTGLGQTLTGIDMHTPATNEKGHDIDGHVFVVGYQGPEDDLNPHNWSRRRRLCYTLLIAKIGLIVGFASSVDSAAAPQAAEEFGVSITVESLATAMYLLGFGLGAPFAAPLSETFGRNPVYLGTMTLFMVFVMASGLAPNIGAQLIFRLFAGFFGSTPLTCAGGSISDMWDAVERTVMFPVFANAAFWGPILGIHRLTMGYSELADRNRSSHWRFHRAINSRKLALG